MHMTCGMRMNGPRRVAGKDKMELLLSMGATRWEASREMIQRCVKLAMTPVLNQMNVVGIVSIPGMMTGQILGGTDPSQVCARRRHGSQPPLLPLEASRSELSLSAAVA